MGQDQEALICFPTALLAVKNKHKVARQGWNGKGLYVQMYGSVLLPDVKLPSGEPAYSEPFFVIVNEITGTVNTWVPSVSDLQQKDWYVLK